MPRLAKLQPVAAVDSGSSRNFYSDVQLISGFGGAYALTPNLSLTADARVTFSVFLAIV